MYQNPQLLGISALSWRRTSTGLWVPRRYHAGNRVAKEDGPVVFLHETVPQLAQLEEPENTPISPISPARYRQMKESIRQRTADAWIRFVEAVFVQPCLNRTTLNNSSRRANCPSSPQPRHRATTSIPLLPICKVNDERRVRRIRNAKPSC